jgi:hypothetical protein
MHGEFVHLLIPPHVITTQPSDYRFFLTRNLLLTSTTTPPRVKCRELTAQRVLNHIYWKSNRRGSTPKNGARHFAHFGAQNRYSQKSSSLRLPPSLLPHYAVPFLIISLSLSPSPTLIKSEDLGNFRGRYRLTR